MPTDSMTHEEIMQLEGPLLSAAVATEVMGWRPQPAPEWNQLQLRVWIDREGKVCADGHFDPAHRWYHAGQVLEKMKAWEPSLDWDSETGRWEVTVNVDETRCLFASSERAPIAICRAALLAVIGDKS